MLKWQPLVFALLVLVIGGGVVALGAAPAWNPKMESSPTSSVQPAASGLRHRLLWDRGDIEGGVSADGQWASFADPDSGDLGVRNLVTGERRLVTHRGGYLQAQGKTEHPKMSPDGRRIGYRFAGAIRVIGADGQDDRVVLSDKRIRIAEPQGWSADSRWLAVIAVYHNVAGATVLLVSPDGSPSRVALTMDRLPYHVMFSPDGKWLAFYASVPGGAFQPPPTTTRQQSVYIIPAEGAAGAPTEIVTDANMMGWTPDGAALVVRRERNTMWELYLQPVSNGHASGDPQKIHGVTDIGRPMGLTAQGTLIHGTFRYTTDAVLTSVDPATGVIGPPVATMPLAVVGPQGLGGGVRFAPDGKQVLYATTTTTVLIRSLVDRAERTLAPQMTNMRRIEWAADSRSLLIVGTAPGGKEGVYRVDLQSGAATVVFEAAKVWTLASSPDGRLLYYAKDNAAEVQERDLKTGVERTLAKHVDQVFDLKVSRDGSTLAIMGHENLSLLNLKTGVARVLFAHAPSVYEKVWGGEWSADGRHFLAYVSLSPDRFGRKELWSLPVDGGPPIRQQVPWQLRGLSISRDGTQLATMRVAAEQQVWALENFLPPAGQSR